MYIILFNDDWKKETKSVEKVTAVIILIFIKEKKNIKIIIYWHQANCETYQEKINIDLLLPLLTIMRWKIAFQLSFSLICHSPLGIFIFF